MEIKSIFDGMKNPQITDFKSIFDGMKSPQITEFKSIFDGTKIPQITEFIINILIFSWFTLFLSY